MTSPALARRAPTLASPEAIEAERCRRSLKFFVQAAWSQIEQDTPIGFNGGYLDIICDHAQATFEGRIKNCVVNVINRSLKSQIASVFLPAWVWLVKPSERMLSAAWEDELAIRDSRKARELISTPWYEGIKRKLFGDATWSLVKDQNQKQFYENTAGGYRQSTHVGGGTGKGGDFCIGDDLLSIDHSRSDVETASACAWVLRTFFGRRNSPRRSRVFVVGHRLREDDPYGALLSKPALKFVHVPLPLEFDPTERRPATPIGYVDPRTEVGASLCPERWGPEEIEQAKEANGDLYEAIANQRPSNALHKPIKMEWLQRFGHVPVHSTMRIVQTWDTSFKGMDPTQKKAKRSRTCGLVWGFVGGTAYGPLDYVCEHMDFNQQADALREMRLKWPETGTTWIEDEANGAALVSSLSLEEGMTGLIPVVPKGSKYLRLIAVSRFFRFGKIWLPPDQYAPWVPGYIKRLTDFPSVLFDDEIDATSQVFKAEWLPDDPDEDNSSYLQGWAKPKW